MPCWQHEAGLATLSNTWFLCDRCREAMGFARDVAVALELAVAPVDTLQEALAESPTKAGSASAALDSFPPSPPPGAQPERDPAQDLPTFYPIVEGEDWTLACTERVEGERA